MASADPAVVEKAALRSKAVEQRDRMNVQARTAAAETIAARAFPVPVPAGTTVAGFSPIRSEINPMPLLRQLAAAGARLALPTIVGRGKPLAFRAWTFGQELNRG